MENWKIDFEWLRIRHYIKDAMGSKELPDLRTALFLIGIQEFGEVNKDFSKEEKQDLMHVAVCTLLEEDGYFTFAGRDEDGWPHWDRSKPFSLNGSDAQELLLKKKIILYFDQREKEYTYILEEE